MAITILAISLVMVMQLFSGGLRASKTSCDYTRAIVHAKDKMEEMNIDPVQGRGEFGDGFTWETEVSPAEDYTQVKDDKSLDNEDMNLLKIKVKIEWPNMPNQQKAIELVSLKAAKKEK
ncbi:MAG: hypothetical protein HY758_05560 [Nitrospirae bacterium]|nr:hypothetical protein [Nitrospirota bacterium]